MRGQLGPQPADLKEQAPTSAETDLTNPEIAELFMQWVRKQFPIGPDGEPPQVPINVMIQVDTARATLEKGGK